jgi:hypothetical protein
VKDQLSEETVLKEAAEANIETTTVVKILTETEAIGTKGPEASFKAKIKKNPPDIESSGGFVFL